MAIGKHFLAILFLSWILLSGGCDLNHAERNVPPSSETVEPGSDELVAQSLSDNEAEIIARQLQTSLPSPWSERTEGETPLEIQSLDVYEAAFRYLFDHNVSGQKYRAHAFCLTIDRSDPPPALIDRFTGHAPPVLPGSKYRFGNHIRFKVADLRMQSLTSAVLEGGYYEGPVSGSESTLHLVREGAQWSVLFERRNVISTIPRSRRPFPTLIAAHGNAAVLKATKPADHIRRKSRDVTPTLPENRLPKTRPIFVRAETFEVVAPPALLPASVTRRLFGSRFLRSLLAASTPSLFLPKTGRVPAKPVETL